MVGDAQATRQRLLDAATKEFAAYGIAGARVDRIAAEARSNKAQIYHYFGNKDGLFDAVFNALVANTVREVPIDVTDLPGYAGRLFDGYEAHPEVIRLATWYRLERAGSQAPLESIMTSNQHKIDEIERAQRAGQLTTRYTAVDLLALVVHQAALWTAVTPEFATLLDTHSRSHRRRIVTDAVAALLAP
ncbi:TetR family transcriptional regulator [Micromonospora sp. NBC_01796]|uniref:TetR family transcriptional regulator n=1 Tax=Micromonospora sp. NBC_01796 TaxID=2975987 RepID=UPI002DDB9AF8|nr:TetR family transcriptional regulator [Micromonospora sp. NBC_01796]WSA88253.1 TetR family transcriptional regulator [Micromonospora sp. NBC_01796]